MRFLGVDLTYYILYDIMKYFIKNDTAVTIC